MGDRASTPPIPGALTGLVGATGTPVAYFDAPNVLEYVEFTALQAPSGGTSVIQLNTAADGSGSGISVTIADGTNIGKATGSVAIAAASTLYQLVTSDAGGAIALSGHFVVQRTSGVVTFLTTLGNVKLDGNISDADADRDTVLNSIIAGVSKRMQNWMNRNIVQATATDEKVDSIGDYKIQTIHYPIISVSPLTENGTALTEDTHFEMNEEDLERGQIVRISGETPIAWAKGRRVVKLTYVHGYAAVPDDLVRAATAQVLVDFNDTVQSGKARRGLTGKGVDPAAATTYVKTFWDDDTVPAMRPYRRMAA